MCQSNAAREAEIILTEINGDPEVFEPFHIVVD